MNRRMRTKQRYVLSHKKAFEDILAKEILAESEKKAATNWNRIYKPTARKYWEAGLDMKVIPNKTSPLSVWHMGHVNKHQGLNTDFNSFLNQFEYYNCSAELGHYAAFYVTDEVKAEYTKLTSKKKAEV